MKVSRKGFLSSVTAAMAVAALPGRPALASLSSPALDEGSVERFSRLIGSSFDVMLPESGRTSAVLERVDRGRSCSRTEQFSLVFRTADHLTLQEGNYRVRHEDVGTIDLFLRPGAQAIMRADFGLLKA